MTPDRRGVSVFLQLLTPLMEWAEHGTAPGAVVAGPAAPAPAGGRPDVPPPAPTARGSRPIYPFPFIAAWDGSGDAGLASSYQRGPGSTRPAPARVGDDFFRPYAPATGGAQTPEQPE